MCGIAGSFFSQKSDINNKLFRNALSSINHRGPDDEGIEQFELLDNSEIYLGHKRLSILDLTPLGHQPMFSEDRRLVIVFNGEIYNFKEIRAELILNGFNFNSNSDTEVLLAGWQFWGESILNRLIGMFAFAIYDVQNDEIILVRDAFGIKPLFYSCDNNGNFCFGSEIQVVEIIRNTRSEINFQRVFDYIIHGIQDSPNGTFYRNIHHLPPASLLRFSINRRQILSINKWWLPSIKTNHSITFDEAAYKFRKLFLDSVKMHLVSDVSVGAALSGGLDSSAIVCAMRYLYPDMPIHTFSYIASNDDSLNEEKWVDLVNTHVNAIPHKIYVDSDEFNNDCEKLILSQGEPFNSTSIYAQYRIFQEARKCNIPVILEGQGADELLAGYEGYPGHRMKSLFEKISLKKLFSFAKNWKKQRSGVKSPWKAFIGRLLPRVIHNYLIIKENSNTLAVVNFNFIKDKGVILNTPSTNKYSYAYGNRVKESLVYSITEHALPSLLRFGDRNAMAFSIENRVPFLTIPLANFLLSLPEGFLISDDGISKSVLREALRGIVPDIILDRKDKIGFVTPMSEWLKIFLTTNRDIANPSIQVNGLFKDNLFFNVLKNELDDINSNKQTIWRIINFSYWLKLKNTNQS
jgi:asparagine synthase (glutamine-hydrolysing)